MASIGKRDHGKYRARYRDTAGKEYARHLARKVDAQRWLDQVTASVVAGTYVSPATARTTVRDWCATWLAGYATRRPGTVRQARVHLRQIEAAFGTMPLSAVRPSHVKSWTASLHAGGPVGELRVRAALPARPDLRRRRARRDRAPVAVLAAHLARRGQPARLRRHHGAVLGTARRDAGTAARGRPARRVRRAPVRRGMRAADRRRRLHARDRHPGGPVPGRAAEVRHVTAGRPGAAVARAGTGRARAAASGATVLTGADGGQLSTWALERAMRTARAKVEGLPTGFRYHGPAALLRLAPDRLRRRREGRPAPAAACGPTAPLSRRSGARDG